ncbi:ankyrin repeat domain-containing protein [Leptospira ognonensis]|uniref:Ankyrin repeat domain-containing protein n=1 Tax=Leptospira ognonensis TaxID=2484945 RepID=A0A4R9K420_9LEPT|nr:ankyrin repeat domain-containing protein [Leptospira ognonensis]TGL60186.1 ankyrin repeat domain-containing protein [Leptospira ognonensis]
MKQIYSHFLLLFFISNLHGADLDISKMRDPKSIMEKVNKGYDVNSVRSSDGYTLLHYAAELGNVELASFLIKKGSSLNPTMKSGATPLGVAINFNKKEVIQFLLDAGVDPNFKLGSNDSQRSHFHYYITKTRKIDKGIFALFLKKGANLETIDFYTETPLISAAQLDFIMKDNAKFLIEAGANIQAVNKFGITPLMNAVFIQNIDLLKFLLQSGAPVDQVNNEGSSALIAMIHMGTGVDSDKQKPTIIDILLNAGANIDLQNNDGNTAIHHAVVGGRQSILDFLIQKNPAAEIRNKKGKTALDLAIINENWDAVKSLLTIEKDLDKLDSYGSTKLHSAIINEKMELIKLLLAAGADNETKDKWGKSPIDLAKSLGNQKIISLLTD